MIDLDQEIFLRETFTVLGHSKFIACLALSVDRYVFLPTLWCQLEDTVLLIGTLLLLDPILFPKYEV